MVTIGSLFSGIGGLELGLEWAGLGPVLWQVESDPYCRAVLERHWPEVLRLSDVRTVGRNIPLPPVDLICGGFPCQDVSLAGKGDGIEGARSGLWGEYARILRDLRPRFAVVENVPGLYHRGLGRVLGDLAGLGYDSEWFRLSAAEAGAPHLRWRVFIIAHLPDPDGAGRDQSESIRRRGGPAKSPIDGDSGTVANPDRRRREGGGLEEPPGLEGPRGGESDRRGEDGGLKDAPAVADPDWGRLEEQREPKPIRPEAERWRIEPESWWASEPDLGRVAHGVPSRVDRLRCLGNAVVPQVAEIIGRRIVELRFA